MYSVDGDDPNIEWGNYESENGLIPLRVNFDGTYIIIDFWTLFVDHWLDVDWLDDFRRDTGLPLDFITMFDGLLESSLYFDGRIRLSMETHEF